MHKMRFDAQHQTSVSGREKHGPYDAVTVELLHASSPSRLLSRAPLARSKGRVHCRVVLTSTWWICYVGLFNVTFNSEKPDCHLKGIDMDHHVRWQPAVYVSNNLYTHTPIWLECWMVLLSVHRRFA